jgi:hypothetical protein
MVEGFFTGILKDQIQLPPYLMKSGNGKSYKRLELFSSVARITSEFTELARRTKLACGIHNKLQRHEIKFEVDVGLLDCS